MEIVNTKAVGKIILMGEHSVVYGHYAIASPFYAILTDITLEKNPENIIISYDFNGRLEDIKQLIGFEMLIEYFNDKYGFNDFYKIKLNSNVPIKRGLGSSASIAVALSKSLFEIHNMDYTNQEIFELAMVSEKIFHSNPSGVDVEVIINENNILFSNKKKSQVIDSKLDAYLVVADTRLYGVTKDAVNDVNILYNSDEYYKNMIEELGEITIHAADNILNKDLVSLGKNMLKSHEILKNLTVSCQKLDKFVEIAMENNALGAKLTGSGRGGCMIALCQSLNIAENIAKKLALEEADTWISYLGDGYEKSCCKS